MKTLLLIFFTTFAIDTFSQYTTIDVTPIEPKEKTITYDTTSNICFPYKEKEYIQYIGQEIIFYECAANYTPPSRIYGNFILPIPDTIWHKIRKKPRPSDYTLIKTYKGKYFSEGMVCFGGTTYQNKRITSDPKKYFDTTKEVAPDYYTPASEIEGKKFKILNIEIGQFLSKWSKVLKFTLLSETGDTLLWYLPHLTPSYPANSAFPCIISSYCKFMEQSYVGKTFLIKRKEYGQKMMYKAIDTRTGEKIPVSDTLTCTSLSFVGLKRDFRIPCMIFTGSNNKEIAIPITKTPMAHCYLDETGILLCHKTEEDDLGLYDLKDIKIIQEEERVKHLEIEQKHQLKRQQELAREEKRQQEWAAKKKRCISKFGKTWAEVILQGKVSIGMTKEMCREAWGNPDSINTTSGSWGVTEQWGYGYSSFLYFENGKLKTIQHL